MLKQFKRLRGSKLSGTRRALMILKIFLEMEWMLILGSDVGLYVYFIIVVGPRLFGLSNCKATGDHGFPRWAVRILPFRTAIR